MNHCNTRGRTRKPGRNQATQPKHFEAIQICFLLLRLWNDIQCCLANTEVGFQKKRVTLVVCLTTARCTSIWEVEEHMTCPQTEVYTGQQDLLGKGRGCWVGVFFASTYHNIHSLFTGCTHRHPAVGCSPPVDALLLWMTVPSCCFAVRGMQTACSIPEPRFGATGGLGALRTFSGHGLGVRVRGLQVRNRFCSWWHTGYRTS